MSGPPGTLYDSAAVVDEEVEFNGHGGAVVDAYLARPVAPGAYPAVIQIHAAPGITPHSRDVVRRVAALGYVCCVPNLYSREGPPPSDFGELMQRLFAMRDAYVTGDLEGAASYLRERGDATGRVGTIGFCMGGRYALLLACSSDRIDAAVDCWGGFITRADPDNVSTPQRPVPPVELVGQLSCPLLAAIGLDDHNPSPQDGRLLEQRLQATGGDVRVDFYENAGHAFFDETRDGYRPQAAALLWERVVEFFARTLS